MTLSGTPRPVPILADVLRPPGEGVGEVECVVDKPDVEEAGKGEACRDEVVVMEEEAFRDEEAVIGKEVGMREVIDMVIESSGDGVVNMVVGVNMTKEWTNTIVSWPLMIVLKAAGLSAGSGAADMTEGEYCNRGLLYGPVENESIGYCIALISSTTRTVINSESDEFLGLPLL